MHGLDQRVQQQIAGNRTRVLLLTVHAQGERLDAATHRIAFVRREHAAQTVLREVDALAQLIVLDHHEAGVDFGMAGQILGGGMKSSLPTTMPAITSPWPLRYLVALWTTTSAPQRRGCCRYGVTNVLSTMAIAP